MSTGSPTAADTARRAALVGTAGYLFACVLWGLNLPLSASTKAAWENPNDKPMEDYANK